MESILHLPKTRWGAVAGHLLISVAIFVLLYALIAYSLFPHALFWVAGGIEGIKIIAGVDLILGPALTLVIYNVAKPRKELLRDIAIIALVQISALLAGMAIVYKSRPIAVVYVYDTLFTTKASELKALDSPMLASFSWLRPSYYYADLPADDAQARSLVVANELAGEGFRLRSDLFKPLPVDLDALRPVLRGKAKAIDASKPDCVALDIATAFDARLVCLDIATPAIRHLP